MGDIIWAEGWAYHINQEISCFDVNLTVIFGKGTYQINT